MDEQRLEEILLALQERKIAVVGDFCIDRYLHIDPDISDCSHETGRTVHQVVEVRPEPGGGANALRNLVALGVGEVYPVGFIGGDGDGSELSRILDSLGARRDFVRRIETRPTPVYTKPLIIRPGKPPEELSRFDIFPREPLGEEDEEALIADTRAVFETVDVVVVADYGEAGKEGTVTPRLREVIAELARADRDVPVLADSRLHIDRFRNVLIKPNAREAMTHLAGAPDAEASVVRLAELGRRTAERNKRPVLITLGADGILLCAADRVQKVPAFPVDGETDIVGAGDAVLAAVAAALAAGAGLDDAAILGMVAASITIQQIGVCGAASPETVRRRFKGYAELFPDVVSA